MSCPYQGKCHSSDYGTDCKYEGNETSCPQYKHGQSMKIPDTWRRYPESDLVETLKAAK